MQRRFRRLAFVVFGICFLVACGDPGRDDAHGFDWVDEGVGGDDGAGGALDGCKEGKTKPCRIDLGEHNGVQSCIDGIQTCVDGEWSECEGDLTT